MKAWRVYGPNDIRLDEIPQPAVKNGWVVLKVRMVQLSVTEVQLLEGVSPSSKKLLNKCRAEGPQQFFGHEFCGEVVETGEGVKNLAAGDRVFWGIPLPCNKCKLCAAGYGQWCRSGPIPAIHMPGCLAEYASFPAECLVKVPDRVSDSEATAMQPFLSSLRRVLAAGIELGDTVAVFGQGVMGSSVAQLSRALGANRVIGVDIDSPLLAVARQLGVDSTVNARDVDPVEAILSLTNGVGADVVFECAGGSTSVGLAGSKTLTQAVASTRDGGKVVPVGIIEETEGGVLDMRALIQRSIEYRSARVYSQKEVDWVVELVASKKAQLAPLVTHFVEGLEEAKKAIEITTNKKAHGAINPAQIVVSR